MISAAEINRTHGGASHSDRVHSVVKNQQAVAGLDEVSISWQRCLSEHGVDPGSHEAPRILTAQELRENRGPVEELIAAAQEEKDALHAIVGKLGYAVVITSSTGVVVDYRGDPDKADQFKHWGIWMGGIWSEDVEGTNGIGTCIAEQRPVTVHCTQHFRTRHTSLSCCGAPVFGPDGKIAAVLDVTSLDPEVSDRSHALALVVAIDSARAIEEKLFRRHFCRAWTLTVAVPSTNGLALMLAVDADQRIVGADHNARSTLGLDDHLLATGVSLRTIFDHPSSIFGVSSDDMPVLLTRIGEDKPWRALVTPPSTSVSNKRLVLLHTRPRIRHMDQIFREIADAQRGAVSDTTAALSPRERRIVELIGQGQSNKEIARALDIAPETVKSHIKNIFAKLGVERRAQAISRAHNLGLVTTLS